MRFGDCETGLERVLQSGFIVRLGFREYAPLTFWGRVCVGRAETGRSGHKLSKSPISGGTGRLWWPNHEEAHTLTVLSRLWTTPQALTSFDRAYQGLILGLVWVKIKQCGATRLVLILHKSSIDWKPFQQALMKSPVVAFDLGRTRVGSFWSQGMSFQRSPIH